MHINIPADVDGFILMQCPLCNEHFKLRPSDIEADDTSKIFCPFCGIVSENYFTQDVIDLALSMVKNEAMKQIHNELKKIERTTKNNMVSLKAGRKPKPEYEKPIVSIADSLVVLKYDCCKKDAKVVPLTKMCGSYCPYCGVRFDGNE